MRMLWLLSVCLAAALMGTDIPPAHADSTVTTAADIRTAARKFLTKFEHKQEKQGHIVSFQVGTVDPRLRLAPCNQPVGVTFQSDPQNSTRVTLQASCTGKRPWRLYLNAEIRIKAKAYVTSTPLARGTRLTADMVSKRLVVINQTPQSLFQTTDGLLGMELVRPVGADTLLTASLITAPNVVGRGDRVIINAKIGSIIVSTRGTALSDGRMGQQILVRNARSRRTVRAVVTGSDSVMVPM